MNSSVVVTVAGGRKVEEKGKQRGPKGRSKSSANRTRQPPVVAKKPVVVPPPPVAPVRRAPSPSPATNTIIRAPTKNQAPKPIESKIAGRGGPAQPSTQEKTGGASKTKVRKKRGSSSNSMNSMNSDGIKSSSEDEKEKKNKKSSPHSSSDSPKKSQEQSKEPTETKKKFNSELAQTFFKQYSEKQRSRRRSEDTSLEKMPESYHLNASIREFRKKIGTKTLKTTSLEAGLFRPDGEPMWVVHELEPEKSEKDADGRPITNPELAEAMAIDKLSMNETKWVESGEKALNGNLDEGKQPEESFQPDPFASVEDLEQENDFFGQETLIYNTAKTLGQISTPALLRTDRGGGGVDRQRQQQGNMSTTVPIPGTVPPPKTVEETTMKTCIITDVKFDFSNNIRLTYDRNHPIASIQKFRKKYEKTLSREQSTSLVSKEQA